MTKWYSAKEAPDLYEWIVAEWYDGDEKEYKYETDFGTPSANWDEYVKRNNITKWCLLGVVINIIIVKSKAYGV